MFEIAQTSAGVLPSAGANHDLEMLLLLASLLALVISFLAVYRAAKRLSHTTEKDRRGRHWGE